MIRAASLGLVLLTQALTLTAAASPLFEDRNPNVWLVEPETQALIPLTAGRWLESYFDNGQPIQPLVSDQQALVNGLPMSLQPMQVGQPAISIAGLGEASGRIGDGPVGRPLMQVWPASGEFTQTIAVEIGIDPAEFGKRPLLPLRIERSDRAVRIVPLCGTATTGCQPALTLQDGSRGLRDFIVANGTVDVVVSLLNAQNQPLVTERRRYGLLADDPQRDSDGDGIPDLIEAAIGLDPTRADFDQDRDGDGWSDFDEWLRCPVAYAADDSCPAVDDENLSPIDTDQDGWSDLDEQWRGTRDNDPEPQLSAIEGEARRLAQRLRFKDYPNARRLYEREYRFRELRVQPRTGTEGASLSNATAHLPDGKWVWQLEDRLSQEEVLAAGLSPGQLVPTRLRDTADDLLKQQRLPITRVPAGDGVVVDAWQPVGAHIQTYKRVLPPLPDADLHAFLATEPRWVTVADFRNAYIDWLRAELVVTVPDDAALNMASTRTALALERLLTDEARLVEAPAPIVFNSSVPARRRAWLNGFLDVLNTSAAPQSGLERLITQLDIGLAPDGLLSDIGQFIDTQTAPGNVPDGLYADLWLAQRFDDSSPTLLPDCTVTLERLALLQEDPEAYAEFLSLCPEFRTEDELYEQEILDLTRRFGLRAVLLFDIDVLAADRSLLDPDADSDGDGASNFIELARLPLRQASNPTLVDSDGDGVPDGNDPCPNDPLDACIGPLFAPRLMAVSDVTVREDTPGGVAAVVLFLDRPGSVAALIGYETWIAHDDTATPGADFGAISGTLRIAPGSTRGVVAVPIVFDTLPEDLETFTLRLTPLSGVIGEARDVRISIVDVESGAINDPPTAVAQVPASVDSGEVISLNGTTSVDPLGNGLTYRWEQTTGPLGELMDAQNAVAAFRAPVVSDDVIVQLRLTVEDSLGRSSSTVATVSVNAAVVIENRPPELIGEGLEYAVALGETLFVPKTAIRDAAVDPDGDLLSVGAVEVAPIGGVLRDDDEALVFRPFRGMVPITPPGQRVIRSVVAGAASDKVLSLVDGDLGSEVWLYDAVSDAAPIFVAKASDLIARAGSSVFYITVDDGLDDEGFTQQRLQRLRADNLSVGAEPLGVLPNYLSLRQGVRLDPRNGDLYYCGAEQSFSVGTWLRLPGNGQVLQDQGHGCFAGSSGGNGGPEVVAFSQGYCFIESGSTFQQTLYCAQEGAGTPLKALNTFSGRITDMVVLSGPETLFGSQLKLIEADGSTVRFWGLIGPQAADGPDATFNDISPIEGQTVARGAVAYVPMQSDEFSDNRQMQLYRWNAFISTPFPISQPVFRGDFRSGPGGFTVDDEGRIYWYRVNANPPGGPFELFGAQLEVLNPAHYQPAQGGNPVQLTTFSVVGQYLVGAQAQTGSTGLVYDGRNIVLNIASVGGVPSCQLIRVPVTPPGVSDEVDSNLSCFEGPPRLLRTDLLDPLLVFNKAIDNADALVRFDGPALISPLSDEPSAETGFAVPVRDPDGAFVNVPVRINVTREVTP